MKKSEKIIARAMFTESGDDKFTQEELFILDNAMSIAFGIEKIDSYSKLAQEKINDLRYKIFVLKK